MMVESEMEGILGKLQGTVTGVVRIGSMRTYD